VTPQKTRNAEKEIRELVETAKKKLGYEQSPKPKIMRPSVEEEPE